MVLKLHQLMGGATMLLSSFQRQHVDIISLSILDLRT